MLVLSRQVDESIFIICPDGTKLEIKVTAFHKRGYVRLGITAPPAYLVHRQEVWEQIQKEKEA